MLIRKMSVLDCPSVFDLQRQCFSIPWSMESLEEMFSTKGYHNYVAESEDGKIVGYIGMKAVLDEADITNVAVSPEIRRQGIGKRLINYLIKCAEENAITHIFLEVRASNEAAAALYKQSGFQQMDIRKNYYEKPSEDALIMCWKDTSFR